MLAGLTEAAHDRSVGWSSTLLIFSRLSGSLIKNLNKTIEIGTTRTSTKRWSNPVSLLNGCASAKKPMQDTQPLIAVDSATPTQPLGSTPRYSPIAKLLSAEQTKQIAYVVNRNVLMYGGNFETCANYHLAACSK